MWRRYGLSWRLVRSSWWVLWHHSDLLFFPLLTVAGAALMLTSLGLVVLLWLDFDVQRVVDAPGWVQPLLSYGWFVISYAIGIYANTALITVVMRLFRGEPADFGAGWRLATARLPSILAYALIMATIGMIFRYILRPVGFLGRLLGPMLERTIIFTLAGLAWHLVPYFVVPIIVSGEVHPLHALQRSADLIKRTWGNDVVVNASVWLIFAVPLFLVGLVAGPALTWAVTTLNEWVVTATVYVLLMLVLLTLLFKMAMDGIFSAAAYEYATAGRAVEHFHPEDLQRAFGSRPSRFVNRLRTGFQRLGRLMVAFGKPRPEQVPATVGGPAVDPAVDSAVEPVTAEENS